MTDVIRTVEVEFLRSGPPHNQLLSPLTEYLAIAGDSGAGTVRVPFEQASFNRRLANLRYGDNDEQDAAPRLETLRTTGTALGDVLDDVPGLVGALSERPGRETLVNLRIVTSASELAMLPFEMAKVPSGTGRTSDDWLALKPGTPVCITRRVRSVPTNHDWSPVPPRVLFIVGLDIPRELEESHKQVLEENLAPWCTTDHEPLIHLSAEEADIHRIRDVLAEGVTSIHILAHGAQSPYSEGEEYGVLLKAVGPEHGEVTGDVITGDRFASVLRSLPTGTDLPIAIVVASCDSSYQADVLVPGGSFAQELHLAGIPLVVASQFPLTFEASVRLTELLYQRLLWGQNPLPAIAEARATLHAEYANTHDWASVVVYDALPENLGEQLIRMQYQRAKTAVDAALHRLDNRTEEWDAAREKAESALERLPDSPAYAMEAQGLRASYAKRIAERYYDKAKFDKTRIQLRNAQQIYQQAANRFLQAGVGIQKWASLHWLETQAISLDAVLGSLPNMDAWTTAVRAARLDKDADDTSERAWAHASLAELWLIRLLAEPLDKKALEAAQQGATRNAKAILTYYPLSNDFHVFSTKRQFERYVKWWATEDFAGHMHLDHDENWEKRKERWDKVNALAKELVDVLGAAAGGDSDVPDPDPEEVTEDTTEEAGD